MQNIFIRARGYHSTGYDTGSGSIIESVRVGYLPAQLRFTSIARLGNGHVLLNGVGVASSPNTIQVSSNLNSGGFSPLGTVNADSNGAFQYDDFTATNRVRQFYRPSYP